MAGIRSCKEYKMIRSKEYYVYYGVLDRCYNKHNMQYKDYRGGG